MKEYKVIYNFSHRTMGFQNQVTVKANDVVDALSKAREKITEDYRVKPAHQKNWTFKTRQS